VPYTTNEAGEKAAKEFCGTSGVSEKGDESLKKEYNKGIPNHVDIGIFWNETFAMFSEECRNFLNRILKECDGNDPLNPQI
jgi:hypothetical protein